MRYEYDTPFEEFFKLLVVIRKVIDQCISSKVCFGEVPTFNV